MLKYFLLSALIAIHTAWAKPVVHHHGELTPHVVIVTPQAQLQLESLAHGTPIIQHLSPFTRFVSPHEETIVYVPTSAIGSRSVASVVPAYQYEARSISDNSARQGGISPGDVFDAITGGFQNPIGAISSGISAASNAALNNPCDALNSVATNSPQGWAESIGGALGLPSIVPPASAEKSDKLQDTLKAASPSTLPSTLPQQFTLTKTSASGLPQIQHIEYEIPITPILANEPRQQHQHYAGIIAPTLPHVVDFIQAPIFLSPSIPTIKGRSLEADREKPIIAIPLPEALKPEALPLNTDIKPEPLPIIIEEIKEKLPEIGRFLEANALKEELSSDTNSINQITAGPEPEALPSIAQVKKQEPSEPALKPNPIVIEQPQSKVA